jgi:uncharacterized protein (TIGR03790 family)
MKNSYFLGLVVFLLAFLIVADSRSRSTGLLPYENPGRGPLDRRHLALVINAADPISVAIGNHYQRMRKIPSSQVIRIRLPAGRTEISPQDFQTIKRQVDLKTPAHIQIYALAWAAPYKVGCQSITSAFTFGWDPRNCASGCANTRISSYYAKGDIQRPWDQLGIRPSMLLAATSPAEGRKLINRGVAADGTAPPGTAYLIKTGDYKRNVRARSYAATLATASPDFQIKVLQTDALVGATDVMAYFTGLAVVEDISSNRFRPGAVADHLTSFGGKLTDSSQMSSLRWLEDGATGSYGTVVEPCNIVAKFPNPGLFLAYYLRGDTLIESYWRSVAMPGQGVFIGEPLARPWSKRD